MARFLLELASSSGQADSGQLDRLAEIAYDIDELENLTLALNDDGSVDVTFEIVAPSAREAGDRGVALIARALHVARNDNAAGDEAIERYTVAPSADREPALA